MSSKPIWKDTSADRFCVEVEHPMATHDNPVVDFLQRNTEGEWIVWGRGHVRRRELEATEYSLGEDAGG